MRFTRIYLILSGTALCIVTAMNMLDVLGHFTSSVRLLRRDLSSESAKLANGEVLDRVKRIEIELSSKEGRLSVMTILVGAVGVCSLGLGVLPRKSVRAAAR